MLLVINSLKQRTTKLWKVTTINGLIFYVLEMCSEKGRAGKEKRVKDEKRKGERESSEKHHIKSKR